MRPTDKPKYESPGMRSFASADDLLIHYADRGNPENFATVLKFVRECEAKLAAQPTAQIKTRAERSR